MAEHIVDVLEAVEVNRERRDLVGLLVGLRAIEGQPFVERDTLGSPVMVSLKDS